MADDAARRDANRHPSMLAIQEGSNELRQVRVDEFGRLVVVGGGAAPAATSLRVIDRTDATKALAIDANGQIGLNNYPNLLTDAQLRAAPVVISGVVTGPLTDAQLRISPVVISGVVSGPLTDSQLRAAPVVISGVVSGPLTDAQLRASELPVVQATLRTRFDYGTRTDSRPVYIGKALQSTADSGTWRIQRFTYDASNRPIDIQVLDGAWSNRTTLGWT